MLNEIQKYYFRNDLGLESPVKKVWDIDGKLVSKKICEKCKHSEITGWLLHFGNSDQGRCWGCMTKGYVIFRVYTAKEMQPVIRANAKKVEKQEIQRKGNLRRAEEAKAKSDKRQAEFEKMKAERAAKSDYIGTVGVRQSFVLTVNHVHPMDGFYGMSYINICNDADDNIVIYKGTQCWGKGSAVECVANIKEHNVREGAKQTIIKIPKKVTINGEAY